MKIFQSRDLMSKLNVSKLPSSVLTKVLCNFFRLVLDQDHWLRVKNCSASIDVVILLTSFRINGWRLKTIQVNLCQKYLFTRQLTHNMTTDCSLNYEFSTRKFQVDNTFCTKFVLNVKTKSMIT